MEKTPLQAIMVVTSLGIQFAVSLAVGYFAGSYLDDRYATGQFFMITGVFLGLGAGVLGAYRLVKPFLE